MAIHLTEENCPGKIRERLLGYDVLGEASNLHLAEAEDTIAHLEKSLDIRITKSLFGDCTYPSPGYCPEFEALEDAGSFYEIVFITDDDNGHCVLFVDKASADADLLKFCSEYSNDFGRD